MPVLVLDPASNPNAVPAHGPPPITPQELDAPLAKRKVTADYLLNLAHFLVFWTVGRTRIWTYPNTPVSSTHVVVPKASLNVNQPRRIANLVTLLSSHLELASCRIARPGLTTLYFLFPVPRDVAQ
ncbi:hypothetical protein GGX14DRAFT_394690 [Mycena pura]|uniref:Uncharacterized protein n=1 Tax=Mycena pura TaxID=153505 RepID=A0AAD6YDF7_9AGAR|nr:hypothetical protein GGX14DRAFT_394690 [Mycena pura]